MDAELTRKTARPVFWTAGSARRLAGGFRRTGRRKWSGSTASATKASRSSISTSISSRTTASAGVSPGRSCTYNGWASWRKRRAGGASAQARAAAFAGHDAASGRLAARWLEGQPALDLIVTLDDATGAIYSGFLVEEEGTASTFRALKEVFSQHGLPMSLDTDRGSHYFRTTKAGEIDRGCPTQVGRALAQFGRRAYRGFFSTG